MKRYQPLLPEFSCHARNSDQPVLPESPQYKLVPISATVGMIKAANAIGHEWRALPNRVYDAMLAASPAPQEEAQGVPTELGIYAWASDDAGSFALVRVHKRPHHGNDGGVLKASTMHSCEFYNGCAVGDWGEGRWIKLRTFPPPPSQQKVEGEGS